MLLSVPTGALTLPKGKKAEFSPERVREVSIAVYKIRLEADSPGAVERMLEKDGDDGKLLSGRAGAYDALSRVYLKLLNHEQR